MTSINNSSLSNDNNTTNDDTNDNFGMNFYYNNPPQGVLPSFNGNITSITWKSANSPLKTNRYDYSYDDLYRLKAGLFRYKTNLSDWTLANGNYNSEKEINYDLNGNILSLQRTNENGLLGDNLAYEY